MKKVTITHRNLNNGTPTDIYHCLPDDEFKSQFSEIFEQEHYKIARKKGVYVDFGANIGLTYHYFKDFATQYYAYEPNPQIFECLALNTQGHNVRIFNQGISYMDKTEQMHKINDSPAQMMFPETKPIESVYVDCVSPETVFKDIKKCDVLKIDVEGFEYMILPSPSFEKVSKKVQSIIGESHFIGTSATPDFIPEILKEYGFETEFLPFENLTRTLRVGNGMEFDKSYHLKFKTVFYAKRP